MREEFEKIFSKIKSLNNLTKNMEENSYNFGNDILKFETYCSGLEEDI